MKILLSGASGLIGKALRQALTERGDQVIYLVRKENQRSENTIFWDPGIEKIDRASLIDFDAVVNLAGENIASGRWTDARKKQILDSRIQSTNTLVNALIELKHPPKVLVSASAIGYYGDRKEETCTEESGPGHGFLADVCRQWEAAAAPAEKVGIRTVFLRTGIVLSQNGGALSKMLFPFKLGLGGVLGTGEQYMSWIAIEDIVGAIIFAIDNDNVKGPVNAVAPHPVKNEEFTKTLAETLHRPAILPVPAFLLRGILGKELANEMLLSSTSAVPKKLLNRGYSFKYPDLKQALNSLLSKE